MRRVIDDDYLTLLFRFIIGLTFIFAAYYKIVEPSDFAKSIWYYHMLPGKLINLMALIMPWVELLCGLGLIFGVYYRGSVLLINIMMVMFIIALSYAVINGISIDCGCFKASKAGTDSAKATLWRDLGMMILTVQLLISRSKALMLCKK